MSLAPRPLAVLGLPPNARVLAIEHGAVRRNWREALGRLGEADRRRAAAIEHPGRAVAYVAGRLLVREASHDAFSIAHGNGASVLLAAPDAGIDIEPITQAPAADAWPDGFDASEMVAIAGLPRTTAALAFTFAWTYKEAMAKARGAGAADPFAEIDALPLIGAISTGGRATPPMALRSCGGDAVLLSRRHLAGTEHALCIVLAPTRACAVDAADHPSLHA